MIKQFLNFLNKFKYKPVRLEEITWDDQGEVADRSTITFYENGFGKRKAKYTKTRYGYCKVENHQYWHGIVLPWLAHLEANKVNKPAPNPVKPKKFSGNVISFDFRKKK